MLKQSFNSANPQMHKFLADKRNRFPPYPFSLMTIQKHPKFQSIKEMLRKKIGENFANYYSFSQPFGRNKLNYDENSIKLSSICCSWTKGRGKFMVIISAHFHEDRI